MTVGFKIVAETQGFSVYNCEVAGAEPHWLVVKLSEPIEEDVLLDALEVAGVARGEAIEALHQCGF